jgi:hypothetical protein
LTVIPLLNSVSVPMMTPARTVSVLLLAGIVALALGCGSDDPTDPSGSAAEAPAPNTLTASEEAEGWTLLFDGESFEGWTGLGRDTIPPGHWRIEDGTIRKVESGQVPTAPDGQPLEGGDIMTEEAYRHFELKLEWKASKGGNSGIKYNVSDSLSTAHEPVHAALGFEYQLLDDQRHPDSEEPSHRASALYDLIPPGEAKALRPVGEWNQARLVFQGPRGEHWLNGEKVLEYDLTSSRFDSLFAASKYANIEGFRSRRAGHIVLQDHGNDFWFRNIKIRALPAPETADAAPADASAQGGTE